MSISTDEEKLFLAWQECRNGFVRDGVVSEESFLKSKHRIVFILKEVNDVGGGGWDLREFVREGGRRQTWNNIARWVHGINHLPEVYNWDQYSDISEDFRRENLQEICVMNLKKSPGTHTTEYAALKTVAHEDSDNLRAQYSLYNPKLTICCGTADLFKEVIGHNDLQWYRTSKGIWWYKGKPGSNVVSFAHPEARVQSSLLLYGLLDAVSEICA